MFRTVRLSLSLWPEWPTWLTAEVKSPTLGLCSGLRLTDTDYKQYVWYVCMCGAKRAKRAKCKYSLTLSATLALWHLARIFGILQTALLRFMRLFFQWVLRTENWNAYYCLKNGLKRTQEDNYFMSFCILWVYLVLYMYVSRKIKTYSCVFQWSKV